jgi:thioredoxin reductase (NADPH)
VETDSMIGAARQFYKLARPAIAQLLALECGASVLRELFMSIQQTKLLVVGAGPAGYTAAIYGARANLAPILITGLQPGGQLTITTEVENFPGFAKGIQGPELMEQMRQQAEFVGVEIVHDLITSIDLSRSPVTAIGDSGNTYIGHALIIATGAQARWLGLPSEKEFSGFGVSACATCDGFFFRDKEVVVVGGGNTAVEEAQYLTNHASKVTVIHRRSQFRAEKILQDRLFANRKIDVVWDHSVEEILGQNGATVSVTGVRIRHVRTGKTRILPADGVFVAIGHNPATSLFRNQLAMDSAGYIQLRPWSTATSSRFVWAAGDCADSKFRQAVLAAGMGCMAAIEAEKYIADLHAPTS